MNSNVKTENRTFLALSTAVVLACVPVVPNAFAEDAVRTETVKFQDLNVGTQAGVQALYGRIHSAARHVCTETDAMRQALALACTRRAEAEVLEKLNLPMLTAYYRMKTNQHSQTLSANR